VSAQDKMMKSEMSGEKTSWSAAPDVPVEDIIQNAVNSKDHTTWLRGEGRRPGRHLEGKGPFTVFAPPMPHSQAAAARSTPGEAREQADLTKS